MVNQFCYLGDMTSSGSEAEASTIARVRSGWKSFGVLLSSQVKKALWLMVVGACLSKRKILLEFSKLIRC